MSKPFGIGKLGISSMSHTRQRPYFTITIKDGNNVLINNLKIKLIPPEIGFVKEEAVNFIRPEPKDDEGRLIFSRVLMEDIKPWLVEEQTYVNKSFTFTLTYRNIDSIYEQWESQNCNLERITFEEDEEEMKYEISYSEMKFIKQ